MRISYSVIARSGKDLVHVTTPHVAKGRRFQEAWIFGTPRYPNEKAIQQAIEPSLQYTPTENIHRICTN